MYPPVPYPPLQLSVEVQEPPQPSPPPLASSSPAVSEPAQVQNSALGRRASSHSARSPFTAPTPTPGPSSSPSPFHSSARSDDESLRSSTRIRKISNASSRLLATPAKRTSRSTPAAPFKSPSPIPRSTAAQAEPSAATELAHLERRVATLREARHFQLATQRGERDGEDELERLADKWQDAGRLAAEALFEHTSGPAPSSSTFATCTASSALASSSSTRYTDLVPSSPSTTTPQYFTPSRARTTADLVAEYKRSLADEAAFRGVSEAELRAAREGDDERGEEERLRPLDVEVREMLGPRAGVRAKRIKREASSDDDAWDASTGGDSAQPAEKRRHNGGTGARKAFIRPRSTPKPPPADESDDELLVALDALINAPPSRRARAVSEPAGPAREAGPSQAAGQARALSPAVVAVVAGAAAVPRRERTLSLSRAADSADEDKREWTIGAMLQETGIEPGVFGWREGFGAFG